MKFAFPLPNLVRLKASMQPWELGIDGRGITRLARAGEALGYDMICVPEHFVIPRRHVALSGPHYLQAVVAQAHLAGATETIRLNSSITLLPLQHPIVTAKGLATADWLSGGRMTVTFAVGWLKEEFDLLGVPFAERGRIADEYLAAIVELWTSDDPAFEGRYVSFRDVAFEPKPVQKPHLPIWMGGDADPALRRAARFASGWFPFLTKPQDIPARLDFIRSQPDYGGGAFEVMYGLGTSRIGEGHVVVDDPAARPGMSAQEMIDRIGWFGDLGVTMTGVPIPRVAGIEAYIDYAQWVIEEIKPRVP